ncbi:hypothetical protein MLD38_019746 [Melastoma candidum]|nr:hypothetical protein MLD38_019746 [Melastoma candidum]
MNDGEKHKVQSRNERKEMKSGKKRILRDVEEKKPVVVVGLRCIADDGKLKMSESSAKLHSKKHQSPEVGGRSEWGWSRRRSQRVQVESVEDSIQKSDEEEDVPGEEVMTLAEMRSRLNQKVSSGKEKPKKKNKENKKQKAGEKRVGVEDENDHERVMEQVMNDKEEEQENNDRDVNDENEYEDGEEERENMGVLEESGGRGDVEMDMMNAGEDEDNQQEDLENEKEQEEGTVVLVNNMSGKGKGNGDQEADATGILPSSLDESLENGTQVNGVVVEETAADTKRTKRIRCYESKRHALSKRDKDSGVKILGTSGTLNKRLSLVRERPISTKSRIPRHLVSSDSEFYDFDVDRGERKFKKGQVWAIYDEFRRPRRYGLIDEVLSTNPFAVRLKWLAKLETKGRDPSTSCAGCGRLKVTTYAVVKSVGMFSHEVDGERVAREMYDIYPKKGSVWAIYGGHQSLELQDVVICLTSYTEMFGLSLGYLEEIEGFRTVYKRKDIGWDAVRWLGKDDIALLSHQIPARKLLHDVVSDFKDCWVLDPASISPILPA